MKKRQERKEGKEMMKVEKRVNEYEVNVKSRRERTKKKGSKINEKSEGF